MKNYFSLQALVLVEVKNSFNRYDEGSFGCFESGKYA